MVPTTCHSRVSKHHERQKRLVERHAREHCCVDQLMMFSFRFRLRREPCAGHERPVRIDPDHWLRNQRRIFRRDCDVQHRCPEPLPPVIGRGAFSVDHPALERAIDLGIRVARIEIAVVRLAKGVEADDRDITTSTIIHILDRGFGSLQCPPL